MHKRISGQIPHTDSQVLANGAQVLGREVGEWSRAPDACLVAVKACDQRARDYGSNRADRTARFRQFVLLPTLLDAQSPDVHGSVVGHAEKPVAATAELNVEYDSLVCAERQRGLLRVKW